jgi:XapX domain-containing protein
MKPYVLSLAAGLFVGGIYSLLGVKSPAPPMIALIGLLGILLGEQIVPIAKRVIAGQRVGAAVSSACAEPVLGRLPGDPTMAPVVGADA